jgi:hypothetical protein
MPRRTTLTLDDDVARKLSDQARRDGVPFRAVVNEALRRGLNPPKAQTAAPRFRVKARRMGVRPGFDLDSVEQLLDQLEGPARR